ncbi:MAG: c-type cytochrome [Candidatus Kapabacteria bacterium]|nr:c-type cytochrome [Candidatus Kapabacteria bacterium]
MRIFILLILFVASILFLSFDTENDLFNYPTSWQKPYYDFTKNPLSKEKIELGRRLFYDPILSKDSTISCQSCHSQYSAFTHIDHSLSHGINDSIGLRNSPALMNLAWNKSFMWDGAINHLDMQALAPISNPIEMGENITNVVYKLQNSKIYPKLFYNAFNDSIITGEHTLKAISQFMLTLISSNSKYDSVMREQSDFTQQESNGYKIFKANCSTCHTEPLFTNYEFENNGLKVDPSHNDYGRMRITSKSYDSLKFKVPTLRNIEFSYPYMHDGRFKRLSDVINHYTNGIEESETLSKKLKTKINLTSNEKVDLISFLLTLTDKEFLFNPKFGYIKK